MYSKPIHPATVHFPIAFLTLAFGLDILHQLTPALPSFLTSSLPPHTDLTRASYYSLSLGLLTAIPALVTGVQQAVLLIGKQGMYETDASGYGVTMRTKVKALIAHTVANDLVIALSTLVWYQKRNAAAATLLGKLGVGSVGTAYATYQPSLWMVVLEAVLFVLLVVAANIGGSLTYVFGVGFAAGGGGSSKKKA